MKNVSLGKTQEVKFRIKEVAHNKGVKVYQLADKLKISSTYLSKIDKGHINTTVDKLQGIADALEVPVHELIELPKGYGHFYVEGVWQGIRKI